MKIIKQGKKPNKEIMFSCTLCGCEFIAEYGEYSIFDDGHNDIEYECDCPNCDSKCYKCE